jgi:hypothetical protein
MDVAEELGRLRRLGRHLVEVETAETVVHNGDRQTLLMPSYLLERRPF